MSNEPERNLLIVIREALMMHFSDDDLRELSFELGLDYDDSQRKSVRVMDIIGYYDKRDQAEVLARKVMDERPNAAEGISAALALYANAPKQALSAALDAPPETTPLPAWAPAPAAAPAAGTARLSVEQVVRTHAKRLRDQSTFFFSAIPENRQTNAVREYAGKAVASNEKPLMLHDESVRGNGGMGCLLTHSTLYHRGLAGMGSIGIADILHAEVQRDIFTKWVMVNGSVMLEWSQGNDESAALVAAMLVECGSVASGTTG